MMSENETKTRSLALKLQDRIDAVYIPYATSNGRVDVPVMLSRLSELNQVVTELVAATGSGRECAKYMVKLMAEAKP